MIDPLAMDVEAARCVGHAAVGALATRPAQPGGGETHSTSPLPPMWGTRFWASAPAQSGHEMNKLTKLSFYLSRLSESNR